MPQLNKPLKRYTVTKLPHSCSVFEIGNFSTMHGNCAVDYKDDTFLPPSPTGLYCATFVKDDTGSEIAYEIINDSLKRIYQTLWKPSKSGKNQVRFCLFKVKE